MGVGLGVWRGGAQDSDTGVVASDFLHSADGWTKAGKDAPNVEAHFGTSCYLE